MSEEEQEAIEYIKAFQKDLYGASEKNLMAIYIDRVWNYIDKLQKENEELKRQVDIFDKAVKCDKCDCNICEAEKIISRLQKELKQEKEKHKSTIYNFELVVDKLDNSISKDKIREKINELEDKKWELSDEQGCWCSSELLYQIDILNELLEEN